MAWASDPARAVWEPRIAAISRAWLDVELISVAEGVRPAALVFQRAGLVLRCHDLGLDIAEVADGRYVVASDEHTIHDFVAVWKEHNDVAIGAWLGFPLCCRDFFDQLWNHRQLRDSTLWMAPSGGHHGPECNILGRWLGVRMVPHLPCGWRCQPSVQFAQSLTPLWPAQELDWAQQILTWPTRYSSLHGIAIVTMPVVKTVNSTDYSITEVHIDRPGKSWPKEGARGLTFPFTEAPKTFQIAGLRKTDSREWTDNGFASKAAMDAAHEMVLNKIDSPRDSVIDFGSGNGALLQKIQARWPVREVLGIEADAGRAARSKVPVKHARIEDLEPFEYRFDLGLISLRRLEELATTRAQLTRYVKRVLVYSYDEPMSAHWNWELAEMLA